jgi:hypothetical protein
MGELTTNALELTRQRAATTTDAELYYIHVGEWLRVQQDTFCFPLLCSCSISPTWVPTYLATGSANGSAGASILPFSRITAKFHASAYPRRIENDQPENAHNVSERRTWWFPFLLSRRPSTTRPIAMNVDKTNDIHENARLAWISEQALFRAFLAISTRRQSQRGTM